MADPSMARVARGLSLRDTMMAGNLHAIVRNQAQRGPTLVYAHNRHLQRDKSTWQTVGWPEGDLMLEWWSAGAIIDAQLGDHYAFIASALGAAPHQGLNAPHSDTLEGFLFTLPENRYVIDSAGLTAALAAAGAELTPRTDTSTNYGYFPLNPDQLAEIDGLIFVKDIAPSSRRTPPAGVPTGN
jgi:hypothetical protein